MSDDDLAIVSIYGELHVLEREVEVVLLQQPAKGVYLGLAGHLVRPLLPQDGHLDSASAHLRLIANLGHALEVTGGFVQNMRSYSLNSGLTPDYLLVPVQWIIFKEQPKKLEGMTG